VTNKISAGLLLALFAILYLLPLQGHPLFIPDETRYAEIPREMVASGDWIVPRLNGLRYFEKPVMGYWLSAISLSTLGENRFAVRLPSALSTGFAALLVFYICASCYGRNSRLPRLATFVYLSTFGVMTIAGLAILDTPLTLFLTATLILFFKASEEPAGSSRERLFLLGAGFFAGFAFLTKGFLAFAVPVLVVAPYLLWQRRRPDLIRMLVLPVIGALVVSLPWALLIHQREPDFWNYFFWHEHVHRFLSEKAQHAKPFYYFLLVLPAMFMPWTMLLPAAITGAVKNRKKQSGAKKRLLTFCSCWFLFPLLFFTSSSGKLLTYILPCFPPLAILFSYTMLQWLDIGFAKRNFIQWAIGISITLLSLILLAISGLQLFGPEHLWIFDQPWKWLLLVGSISAMLLLLFRAFRNTQELQKIFLFGISFAILLFTIQFTIPTQSLDRKAPGPFLSRHAAKISADTFVISGQDVVRAVCWYLKRDDIYLLSTAGELSYGVKNDDNKAGRLLTTAEASAFINKNRGRIVLISDLKTYDIYLQPLLPEPVSVHSSSDEGYLLIYY